MIIDKLFGIVMGHIILMTGIRNGIAKNDAISALEPHSIVAEIDAETAPVR